MYPVLLQKKDAVYVRSDGRSFYVQTAVTVESMTCSFVTGATKVAASLLIYVRSSI